MTEIRLARLSGGRVTENQRASAYEQIQRIRREVRRDVQGKVKTIRHISDDGYVTESTPIFNDDGDLVELEVRDLGRNPKTPQQEAADLRVMLAAERVQEKFRKGTQDSRVGFVSRTDDGKWKTEAK